jgi:hypothetical protein
MKFQKNSVMLPFLILAFVGLVSNAYTQDEMGSSERSNDLLRIYLGESLPKGIIKGMGKENLVIQLSDDKGNVVQTLNATELAEYTMTNPGEYTIHIHSDHASNVNENQCNHDLHDKKIQLTVLPYRLVFDFEAIEFSRNLVGGVDMLNSTLTLPVEFTSSTNEPQKLSGFSLVGAGINNTVVGTLSENEITLQPGINRLTFKLSGSVQTGTYVMFDFLDPSGRTNCYYFPNQIK